MAEPDDPENRHFPHVSPVLLAVYDAVRTHGRWVTAAEIVARSGSNPETTKKSVKLLTRAGRPSGSPPPRGPTRMRRPRAQIPDATPAA